MYDVKKNYFQNMVAAEFFSLFCADVIAEGSARTVYHCGVNLDLVVKIETVTQSFQNVNEWTTWQSVRNTIWADWFAPCIEISPCGTVMLQRKTKPKAISKYPSKIPNFFTDTKYANYGFIGNRFVCHDYGVRLLIENGLTKRMKTADWWGDAPTG